MATSRNCSINLYTLPFLSVCSWCFTSYISSVSVFYRASQLLSASEIQLISLFQLITRCLLLTNEANTQFLLYSIKIFEIIKIPTTSLDPLPFLKQNYSSLICSLTLFCLLVKLFVTPFDLWSLWIVLYSLYLRLQLFLVSYHL